MKIKVTIYLFLLIFPCVSYPVDIYTIDKNCKEMNDVAWNKYAQSLVGSAVTGTLTLDSVRDGKDNLLGGWRRWKQALFDLVNDPGYHLIFRNKDIDLYALGLSEDHVINLKEKINYEVRYTIEKVEKRKFTGVVTKFARCVVIVAK